jgi:hypothetical protein
MPQPDLNTIRAGKTREELKTTIPAYRLGL